jgi:rhamnosyltransferase
MITILLSTYNGEKYLRDQLDSIFGQIKVDFILVVRDDGSKDSTIDILEEYKRKHSNLTFFAGKNLGSTKSFYKLILEAPDSDYYAFADQDDFWDKDKLYTAICKLNVADNSIPSLYFSSIRPVDHNLKPISYKINKKTLPTLGIVLTQSLGPGCSFVFNKKLLEKFRKLGAENIDIHDWALLRVASALDSYIYYDDIPHFSYRQHSNNQIGSQHTFLINWYGRFKRFFKKDLQNIRIKMAMKIKEKYYTEMSLKNRRILDLFLNYNSTISNKFSFLRTNEVRMINNFDNFIFKILILFNKV